MSKYEAALSVRRSDTSASSRSPRSRYSSSSEGCCATSFPPPCISATASRQAGDGHRTGRPSLFGPDDGLPGEVALKLAISATVTDERLQTAAGGDAAIWSLCADQPHNDILRRADDQATFLRELRRLYDRIKARHGEGTLLNVFPALPASLAVEVRACGCPSRIFLSACTTTTDRTDSFRPLTFH